MLRSYSTTSICRKVFISNLCEVQCQVSMKITPAEEEQTLSTYPCSGDVTVAVQCTLKLGYWHGITKPSNILTSSSCRMAFFSHLVYQQRVCLWQKNISSLTLHYFLEGIIYHFNILVFPLLSSNCVKIIFFELPCCFLLKQLLCC